MTHGDNQHATRGQHFFMQHGYNMILPHGHGRGMTMVDMGMDMHMGMSNTGAIRINHKL